MNVIKKQLASAILLAGLCASAMAVDGLSNELMAHEQIGFSDRFGEDEYALNKNSLQAIQTKYLFIAGSAFNARTSAQTINYPGAGCTYSNLALTTDIQLPDGAKILGVRSFYYNNNQPSDSLTMFLSSYDGAGGLTDHLVMASTFSNGYEDEYASLAMPLLVDNFSQAY